MVDDEDEIKKRIARDYLRRKNMMKFLKQIKKVNFRVYIDAIQTAIKDMQVAVGLESTWDQQERAQFILYVRLQKLGLNLANELSFRGDPNITFMLTQALISCAWMTFIIKAKSKDVRRPADARRHMGNMVKDMENVFKEVIFQAVDYGSKYDRLIVP